MAQDWDQAELSLWSSNAPFGTPIKEARKTGQIATGRSVIHPTAFPFTNFHVFSFSGLLVDPPWVTVGGMLEVGMLQICPTASVFLDSVSTQPNGN